MPAWVHRAAPCVRASLHLVAKVGHFAPLFFRRFASLRYSFADLLRSYSWAASLRSDLLRSYSFAASLRYSFAELLRRYSFAASLRSVILSPHRSAPTCFVSFTASLRSDVRRRVRCTCRRGSVCRNRHVIISEKTTIFGDGLGLDCFEMN